MQPETNNAPRQPEVLPPVPAEGGLDRLPPLKSSPEAGITTGAERHEQVAELSAAQADATATAVSTTQVVPPVVVDGTTASTVVAAAGPLTAGHEDVIEKEWVDRAKKILADTPDDPHKREQQVTELHKDYLRKRYGKELGAAS